MTDQPPPANGDSRKREPPGVPARHGLDFFKPALIVMGIAVLLYMTGISSFTQSGPEERRVEIGRDYYVSVALIELTENDLAGEPWDSNGTAPDIYVEIHWKGNRIYKSTTKADTFVAKWSNAEFDLRDMALKGHTASMDDVIHAARINVKEGEEIVVSAYDDDVVKSDSAGEKVIRLTDLKLGDNLFTYHTPGIKRMVLRVSDMSEPVDPLR